MAKGSQYPSMSNLTGAERLLGIQGTATEKVTLDDISAFAAVQAGAVTLPLLASDQGSDLIGFEQAGGVPDLRTVQAKLLDLPRSPEDYGAAGDGVADDTAAMQAAINATPAGQVVFFPRATYKFKTLLDTLGRTLDFNGSTLIVNRSNPADVSPAIWLRGTQSTGVSINSATEGAFQVTTAVAANAGGFAAGDYVVIRDEVVVPPWNDGLTGGTPGTTYTGRGEVNRVVSVNAGTGVVTLQRPIEWPYSATPEIYKFTPCLRPRVLNIGAIYENQSSGGSWSGLTGNVPHLIHFQYAVQPEVDNVSASQFLLHAVNFHYCWKPTLLRSSAYKPRSTSSGQGYFCRFERCVGALADGNESSETRHHIDYVGSYDCLSSGNVANSCVEPAYITHGANNKRIRSIGDFASSANFGWSVGNPSFNADYDVSITDFTYRGSSVGIACVSKSERIRITGADIKTSARALVVQSGARKISVASSKLDSSAGTSEAILIRPLQNSGDPEGVHCRDIEIVDNDILAGTGSNAVNVSINGATVRANLTGAAVTSYTVLDGGYDLASPVVSTGGGGGSGATGTAVVSGGVLTGVTLGAGGSGYSSGPNVSISGGYLTITKNRVKVAAAQAFAINGISSNGGDEADFEFSSNRMSGSPTIGLRKSNRARQSQQITDNVVNGSTTDGFNVFAEDFMVFSANRVRAASGAAFTWAGGAGSQGTAANNGAIVYGNHPSLDDVISLGNNGATLRSGTGTPEGVVAAKTGSIFQRTDGGVSTMLYIKTTGTGNTGWTAK